MRILLIRLREIGDVVFTTPAIKAVRTRFPDAHLAYVVEPVAEAIVANNPHLDRVIVAPRRRGIGGLRADIALGTRLRSERFDIAIDFHGGPRASLLAWLSRARMRLGYEVVGRSWMYSHRVPRARGLRPRHSVENQWDLLAPLGIPDASRNGYPVEMALEGTVAMSVAERLSAAGVNAEIGRAHV